MQSGIRDTSVPFRNTIFDIVERALGIAASWTGRARGGGSVMFFPSPQEDVSMPQKNLLMLSNCSCSNASGFFLVFLLLMNEFVQNLPGRSNVDSPILQCGCFFDLLEMPSPFPIIVDNQYETR